MRDCAKNLQPIRFEVQILDDFFTEEAVDVRGRRYLKARKVSSVTQAPPTM